MLIFITWIIRFFVLEKYILFLISPSRYVILWWKMGGSNQNENLILIEDENKTN
jgi:hypothetical protein